LKSYAGRVGRPHYGMGTSLSMTMRGLVVGVSTLERSTTMT